MQLETNNSDYSRRQSKVHKRKIHRKRIAIITLTILFIMTVVISGFHAIKVYSTVKKYDNLIYPGIFIEGVNVGGKTKKDALSLLSQKYKESNKERNIIIKVLDKKYTINFSQLNIEYNYDEVINSAFNIHKDEDILKKYKAIKKPKNEELELKYKYSSKKIDEMIKNIENENNRDAVDAKIVNSPSGGFAVKEESYGQAVDKNSIKNAIDKNMNIKGKGNVVVNSAIKEVKPHITQKDLGTVNSMISSFTTNFSASNDNRATNINLASDAINGKVVLPGDSFSFNDVVGMRTEEKGYKPAKVIVGNEFIDDFGGGVCQVSSTLYNAIMRANIPSTERTHHTIASTYVPLGMDATVDFGNIDYKFKNTLKYPIYIESVIQNKNLTFNVYSNKSLTSRTYDLVNEVKGNRVNVYKVTYENGKEIDRQLVSSDAYDK
ncbi:Vancomycin B-type resistance protein VanW [Clostridium liquoris]|jgi:vancomycin resistance protein YoaR|uniref:Vancomycin B-type resistance protein VanW n=1 Tax=Clostridium liquoris TaxID=1289519 RepID=A0A2T0B3Z5_9CLOT|nr:VanW family protein [Clostridium liquoris]PRR78487.1 Vancomycin B-type resistance protein VanW [Clostridium liquoris]